MIERIKYDWERLSTAKKVIYPVLLAGAIIFCALSFSGLVNFFPVG